MDKEKLNAALESAIASKSEQWEQIFVCLVQQVWQLDWTVAPYDIYGHFAAYDVPYFLHFMQMDVGDEAEEKQLIIDWISSRLDMRRTVTKLDRLVTLIDELNMIRVEARY